MRTLLRKEPWWYWMLLGLVGIVTVVIRIRLLDLPLERDEGEFAYMGQLMIQGVPPYSEAYNLKLPGIYVAYGVIIALFGQTPAGIHIGLLLICLANSALVGFIGAKMFDKYTGMLAGAGYLVLSLAPGVLGLNAHATHFVILFSLLGFALLINSSIDGSPLRPAGLIAAGAAFGLAFLMKQPGGIFFVGAIVWLLRLVVGNSPQKQTYHAAIRGILILLIGFSVPIVLAISILGYFGVFDRFWFWTVTYAAAYGTMVPVERGLANLVARIPFVTNGVIVFWILAGLGLCACWVDARLRKSRFLLLVFFAVSFFAVCPGWYFRAHYFVLLLPAIALLSSIGASWIGDIFNRKQVFRVRVFIPLMLVFLGAVSSFALNDTLYFKATPFEAIRSLYHSNPFAESIEIANYVSGITSPSDRIAVVGSEPQIYFYAKRRSATGYLYTYSFMEDQPYARVMQQEFIDQIESSAPRIIVFARHYFSWIPETGSDLRVLDWLGSFTAKHYKVVGVADIISIRETIYRWGEDAARYVPKSDYYLVVFERLQTTR